MKERDRMEKERRFRMKKIWMVLLAGFIAAVYMGCPGNRSPEITGITPSTVSAGDTVRLTCNATDPDPNDVLEYNWKAYPSQFTYISGKDSSTITLIAPSETGTYNFTVEVKDGRGGRAESTFAVTVTSPPTIPAVTLFDPMNPTTSTMDLVWSRYTEADFFRYEVYHATGAGFNPFDLTPDTTIYERNDTTCTVRGLEKNTKYYFKVVVYNQQERYGISNEVYGYTGSVPPPNPVLFEPIVIAPDSVTLMWSWASTGENFDHYEVHKSLHANFTPDSLTRVANVGKKDDTLFTVHQLSRAPWFFRVVVVTKGGESSVSNEVTATPTTIFKYDVAPGRPLSIDLYQNFAYIAARERGVVCLDIGTDPPSLKWEYPVSGQYAFDVDAVGSMLYVAFGDSGLYVFDVSRGTDSLIGRNDSINAISVAGTPNYAYVGGSDNYLRIVGISFPGLYKPVLGSILLPDKPNDIYVSGYYAFVACADAGVQVVDVSNHTDPKLSGQLSMTGTANRLYISHDYAYIAARGGGLIIADVGDPTSPREVAKVKTFPFLGLSIDAYDVYVYTGYAYVAIGKNGLMKVDVSDPENPHPLTLYVWSEVDAQAVRTTSTHAYVGDYNHTFRSVKW